MLSVTARKIREHGSADRGGNHNLDKTLGLANKTLTGKSRVYTGYLVSYPVVGRGMVIFRDPHGHRMITTPVKRVLSEPEGNLLYVETENSVYRLDLHGDPGAIRAPEQT